LVVILRFIKSTLAKRCESDLINNRWVKIYGASVPYSGLLVDKLL
jgi:hypothetical protein